MIQERKGHTGIVYESFADEHLRILREMMKKDPGLIDRIKFFIGVHSEVPADQPGYGPVFKDYYTADPLSTIQHFDDPLHIARSAPVDRDMNNLPFEVSDLRKIAKARLDGNIKKAEGLEGLFEVKYGVTPKSSSNL